MNIMSLHELKTATVLDITLKLKNDNVSVLKSLGANHLRLQMALVGLICKFFIWIVFLKKTIKKRQILARRVIKFFFPARITSDPYSAIKLFSSPGQPVVAYFNHQSLFEVFAIIGLAFDCPSKSCLFPVNLPWFEALSPVSDKLRDLGIVITPMITPKTQKKILSLSPQNQSVVDSLKRTFESEYFSLIKVFATVGDIIAVAPSATRTPSIFPNRQAYHHEDLAALKTMPRTISAIMLALKRHNRPSNEIRFIPISITPKNQKLPFAGVNLFRKHNIAIGKPLNFQQMHNLQKQRIVDFVACRKLADLSPTIFRY